MGKLTLKEIIKEAQKGNEDAKLNLVEKYKPLVNKYSFKYNLKDYDKEDLKQEANIAILKAIEKFDSNSSASFDGYAINAIRNNLNYLARKEIKRNSESSLNLQTDSGEDIMNLLKDSTNIENEHITALTNESLIYALSSLPKDKLILIKGIYFTDKPNLSEYCRKHNLDYSKTRREIFKILDELKVLIS